MLDSGAMITLVGSHMMEGQNVHLTAPRTTVKGVTGALLQVRGEAVLSIEVNGKTFEHNCVIIEGLAYDMLMGFDLLKARGFILDFSTCAGDGPLRNTSVEVKLNHNIHVPAQTRRCLYIKPEGLLHKSGEAWIYPEDLEVEGMRVEEAVASFDNGGRILICIINKNMFGVDLIRGLNLATVTCNQEKTVNFLTATDWISGLLGKNAGPCAKNKEESNISSGNNCWDCCNITKESRERKIEDETDFTKLQPSQKRLVQRLIARHPGAFALDGEILATTPLVQFEIPTGDSPPIKKRPYRLPEYQRGPLKELLQKLKTEGIIRPSNSAWSAPIILVPKKDTGKSTVICINNTLTHPR